jgi:TonB family protein
MKKLIQLTAMLLCSFFVVSGASDRAAQELLVTAKQQASLFHNQSSPFQLDVDFVVQIAVPMHGRLTLKWAAKDRWWRRIDMQGFAQIDVRNGDMLYTTRNAAFTPIRVGELVRLLQFAEDSESLAVKKQKQHRDDSGIEITCLQVEQEKVKHEVCVNPASREILRDEWQEPTDERRKEEYLDYFDFAGHHYPRKLRLLVDGSAAITANIQHAAMTSFDDGLFLPPKGAIERRQCNGMKYPVPVKTPEPAYPKSASENRLMGDTAVAMTVMTDGSVTNIRLIGTATHSMDDATLQTLKGWRFKPAMCGSEPVVSDINVVVSFRLY